MSAHEVVIPAPWRHWVGGQSAVQVEGDTMAAVLQNLTTAFPEFGKLINDGSGLRRSVLLLAGDAVVRPERFHAPLAPGLTIRIVLAFAGG
ncbi:MAG: hypothetical protein ACM3XM_09015 [Mycobacterium leprae]